MSLYGKGSSRYSTSHTLTGSVRAEIIIKILHSIFQDKPADLGHTLPGGVCSHSVVDQLHHIFDDRRPLLPGMFGGDANCSLGKVV